MLSRLIFLLILLLINQSNAQFKKCCAFDQVVEKDSDLSSNSVYSCAKNKNLAAKGSNVEENVIESKSTEYHEFIAFNILSDNHSHWPSACNEQVLLRNTLNEPTKVSLASSCVDLFDNSYHIFTCNENNGKSGDKKDVYKLKKCCPSGMSYDIFSRMCVENDSSDLNDNFLDILYDKAVVFEHDKINCTEGNVLVEYHSDVHELKIFESLLVISVHNGNTEPEVFNRNYFCIESTNNSAIEQLSGMTKEHFEKKSTSKWIAKVCRNKNVCDHIPCIHKCCGYGERLVPGNSSSKCEPYDQEIDIKFHKFSINQNNNNNEGTMDVMEPREYGILMRQTCKKYRLEADEEHYISGKDGSLLYFEDMKYHKNEEYCVDYLNFPGDESTDMNTFICFDLDEHEIIRMRFYLYASLLAISAFFLCVTFLVYILLPKLLNLHGKTVVCHVLSLSVGYSFLSGVQFYAAPVVYEYCLMIGLLIYFAFLSSFSWLNIMCLDIYWTFGSVRISQGIRRTKEMKRFMYYSLYAWGFPFLMTILVSMMNIYDIMPKKFEPTMGHTSCWFETLSSPGHVIFFLLPIGIQISINFILFILTAIHCNRIKAEIHRMQSCDSSDQQKRKLFVADKAIFMMNVKLFCVMGVSWLLEIVATVYKQNSLWWTISDAFNCLQGVLVFLIFVFKKKVLVAFQKKFGTHLTSLNSRPKSLGSTTLTSLDSNSTSINRHNAKISKAHSGTKLTNSFSSMKQ